MKKTCLFIIFTLIAFIPLTASAQTTRFPNGVTNSDPEGNFSELPILNPLTTHVVFDEFNYFDTGHWTVTVTEAGSSSASEAIVSGSAYGVLNILNDNAAADDVYIVGATSIIPTKGKRLWFSARIIVTASTTVNSVTEPYMLIGLTPVYPAPLSTSNGIYFSKTTAVGTIVFMTKLGSSSLSASSVTTIVDRTFATLGFYFDGYNEIKYYVDGVYAGALASTYVPIGVPLAPVMYLKNGPETGASFMLVDYIFVAQER